MREPPAVPLPPSPPSGESLPSAPGLQLSSLSAGLISTVLHLSVMLSLAASSIVQPLPALLGCLEYGVHEDALTLADLPEVHLETTMLHNRHQESVESFAVVASGSEPALLTLELPVTELADLDSASSHGSVAELTALAREPGGIGSSASAAGAEFYGIRAAGERFVYVVDCSTSMEGAKWHAAQRELLTSLRKLGSYRSFYVILFDGAAHPMFGLEQYERDLLPATGENVLKCERWLAEVQLGDETRPFAAVRQALALQPSALFLLTDGEFADPTAYHLKHNNFQVVKGQRRPLVAVHTIGLHNRKSQPLLRRIARENGGQFQFIAE